MPAYANPFRAGGPGYRPTTPVGEAIRAAGTALMSGPTPFEIEDRMAQAEERRANALLRSAQYDKTVTERDILQSQRQALDPDSIDEQIANMVGTTVLGVRSARDYVRGVPGVETMPPPTPVLEAIQRARASLGPAIMGGKFDPKNIAEASDEYRRATVRSGVLSGDVDPTRAAQSEALGRAAPFSGAEWGTTNVFTGGQTETAYGGAHRGKVEADREKALAGVKAELALAGRHGAETRQINDITQTGVGGRYGAPVAVIDPITGETKNVTPRGSLGQRPAAKPMDPATQALRESLARLADTRADAGGFAPQAGAQTRPLSESERKAISATVTGISGGSLDPAVSARIMARAEQIATDPASDWHRNPAGAAEAAIAEIAPQGFEKQGFIGFRTRIPVGGAPAVRQHPGIEAGKAGETGLPPQARARLKEGVVTKFGNGQTWTLQGGAPVQVQ